MTYDYGVYFYNHGMVRKCFLKCQILYQLDFFTDAAGKIGYGVYFQGAWFCHQWEEEQLTFFMTTKELYPIAISASVLGSFVGW